MLRDAADAHNLKLVSEVMDASQIEVVDRYADILQVGARNMQNFSLLREVGHANRPVLLKRGISATIEEWLLSAEYVLGCGNMDVVLMAGPCTIESREQVEAIAGLVKAAGAKILRGGAFKPRTSPYSFQGLGEEGLKFIRSAADRHGLLVVSEVMDRSQIAMMLRYVDILQVGARNMQNFQVGHDRANQRFSIAARRADSMG